VPGGGAGGSRQPVTSERSEGGRRSGGA
jgi:hypothetical protein